jgi:hypothetical protein
MVHSKRGMHPTARSALLALLAFANPNFKAASFVGHCICADLIDAAIYKAMAWK